MKLSENFRSEEFACGCGDCPGSKSPPMDVAFIMKLQKLRTLLGKPIRITSGYRCAAYNKSIGGAQKSLHVEGMAVDIVCLSASERYWQKKIAYEVGFTGIGTGSNFTHVDTRSATPVEWVY